jgi:hypothetical protein
MIQQLIKMSSLERNIEKLYSKLCWMMKMGILIYHTVMILTTLVWDCFSLDTTKEEAQEQYCHYSLESKVEKYFSHCKEYKIYNPLQRFTSRILSSVCVACILGHHLNVRFHEQEQQ